MEGLVGFEPTIRELQSHALPLGYRPILIICDIIRFYIILIKMSIKKRPKVAFLFKYDFSAFSCRFIYCKYYFNTAISSPTMES